jgi:hypothetical protein
MVALDVSHSLIFWLKAVAPANIPSYMMNKATEQVSVMEEKEINCTNHSNMHMMKLQMKIIVDLRN